MKLKWDHRLPHLLIHIVAAILDATLKNIQTVSDYIATNNTSHAQILRMMETELNVNFLPKVIVTRPPITNGKYTEKLKNVSDGLITKEDRGKRRKLELIMRLKANFRLKLSVI